MEFVVDPLEKLPAKWATFRLGENACAESSSQATP